VQCSAVQCSAVQCSAVHCTDIDVSCAWVNVNIIYIFGRYLNMLHCTALHCTALHCTAQMLIFMSKCAHNIYFGRYLKMLTCSALHCTALHCTALHCTVLHCTALLTGSGYPIWAKLPAPRHSQFVSGDVSDVVHRCEAPRIPWNKDKVLNRVRSRVSVCAILKHNSIWARARFSITCFEFGWEWKKSSSIY
jgi:hypothetical protein